MRSQQVETGRSKLMEALSRSESPCSPSPPPDEQACEGTPSDYNQSLQVRSSGSHPDLQLHQLGLEPNFSGFSCEHTRPGVVLSCMTE